MFDHALFTELVFTFGAVMFLATLCHALKLPTIIGFIAAGVSVGPSGLGVVNTLSNVSALAEIATIFLMFAIGLEFSLARLLRMRHAFIKFGMGQVLLTTALAGLLLFLVTDMKPSVSIFWGMAISLSSTALVMKLIEDNRTLETPAGNKTLTILLVQDLAFIPMMLILPLLAGLGSDIAATTGAENLPLINSKLLFTATVAIVAVPLVLYLASKYAVPVVLEKVAATRSRDIFYFGILFICLGTAWIFHKAGLSMSLGAFVAGMLISDSQFSKQVAADIGQLRDAFLGLFFAAVGMMIDLKFFEGKLTTIVAVTLLILVIKFLCILAVGRINRLAPATTVIVGFSLAQIGEFAFILAARATELRMISQNDYQWFLAIAICSMVATPFLFKLAPNIATKVAGKLALSHDETHEASDSEAIIIGYGITGQHVAEAFKLTGIQWHVIDFNHETIKSLKKEGVNATFGDATRAEVLTHAGIAKAKLVIVAVTGGQMIPAILAAIRAARPDVRIIVRTQFVRELRVLPADPNLDTVVGEIETSVEILDKALAHLGNTDLEIRDKLNRARRSMVAGNVLKQ